MGTSLLIYRNPGQTLYGFVQHYYPEVRTYFLNATASLYSAHLYSWVEDYDQIYAFKAPLPPPEQLRQFISNEDLNHLLAHVFEAQDYSPTQLLKNLVVSRNVWGLDLMASFIREQYPHLKIIPVIELYLGETHNLFGDGYKTNLDICGICGYWTPQECQEILPYIQAIGDSHHPRYLSVETQLENFLYFRFKENQGTRAEVSVSVKQNLCAIRETAQILSYNLEQLAPHEGIVALLN